MLMNNEYNLQNFEFLVKRFIILINSMDNLNTSLEIPIPIQYFLFSIKINVFSL